MHAIGTHYQIGLRGIAVGKAQDGIRWSRLDMACRLAEVHPILKP
jgi:hypothetical protein